MTGSASALRTEIVTASVTTALRRAVLRPNWAVGARMHGDDDPAAVHIAAFDGSEVVGACVLLPAPFPLHAEARGAWQLRGMATAPHRRGQGIGTAVLAEAERSVRVHRGSVIWCQARETAIPFYARRGFVSEGGHFLHAETGIRHQLMRRELSDPLGSST